MGCNIFQGNDGIVHHHPNGNAQGGKRNDIEGIPGYEQVYECTYQGHGNDYCHDKGSTPPSKEKEHNEYDQDQGDHDGIYQAIYYPVDVVRKVRNNSYADVGGEVLLQFRKLFQHFFTDLNRVGSCLFLNNDSPSLYPVNEGFLGSFLDSVFHPCHIFQKDASALEMSDNDMFHLPWILKFSFHSDG